MVASDSMARKGLNLRTQIRRLLPEVLITGDTWSNADTLAACLTSLCPSARLGSDPTVCGLSHTREGRR